MWCRSLFHNAPSFQTSNTDFIAFYTHLNPTNDLPLQQYTPRLFQWSPSIESGPWMLPKATDHFKTPERKEMNKRRWCNGSCSLSPKLDSSCGSIGDARVLGACQWHLVYPVSEILLRCWEATRTCVWRVSAVLGKSFMSEWEGVGQGCCGECLKFRGMFRMLFGFCWWVGEDRYLLLNLVRSSWKINKCVLIFTSQSACEILRFL